MDDAQARNQSTAVKPRHLATGQQGVVHIAGPIESWGEWQGEKIPRALCGAEVYRPASGASSCPACWLHRQYWSPLSGLRDLARALVADWEYDADEYPAMLDELEQALGEAIVDTAQEIMREHGLEWPD
jgi:hypothetical protein